MTLVTINTDHLEKSLIFYYKNDITNDFTDSFFINIENFKDKDIAYETIVQFYTYLKQKPSNFFLNQYESVILNTENAQKFFQIFEEFIQGKGLTIDTYKQIFTFSQEKKGSIFCGFISKPNNKNLLEDCFIDFYTNSNQRKYENIDVVSTFVSYGDESNVFFLQFQDINSLKKYIVCLKTFFSKVRFLIELKEVVNFNVLATNLVDNDFRYFFIEDFNGKEYLIIEFDKTQPILPKEQALQQLKNIEKYLYIDYEVKKEKDDTKLYQKTGICRTKIFLEPELLNFLKKMTTDYKTEIGASYQKIDEVKVRLPDGTISNATRIGFIPESLVKGSLQTYAVNVGYYRISSHSHPSYIYPKFGAKLAWPSSADFIVVLLGHYPGNHPLKAPLKTEHFLEQVILHFVLSMEGLYTIQIPYKMSELLEKMSSMHVEGLGEFIELLKYILTKLENQRSEIIKGKERTREEYINTVNSYLEFTNNLTLGNLFLLNDPENSLSQTLELDTAFIKPLFNSLEKMLAKLGINKYLYNKYRLFSTTFTPWELAMDKSGQYFDKGMVIDIETFISNKDSCPLSIDINDSVPANLFKLAPTIIPNTETMIKFDDLVENFPNLHISFKDYLEKCHPTYVEEDSKSYQSYPSPRPTINPQPRY